MTSPVAEKTHIPSKAWRRHTDPPSLWIFVAVSSVSLHLLVFWLMRSSNVFGLWFPQESQSVVPIDLIEIAPSVKSTSEPKLSPTTAVPKVKQSESANTATKLQTTPKNQDADTTSILKKQEIFAQAQTKAVVKKTAPQPKPTASTQPKPSFTPKFTQSTPTPTATPKIPVGNLPWNRRQEIVLGKGKPLPSGIPSAQSTNNSSPDSIKNEPKSPGRIASSTPASKNPNTSASNNSNLPREKIPQNPTSKASPTPTENSPQPPTDNNSNTSEQTGSIATIIPLSAIEAQKYSQDLSAVSAQYQGSKTKELASSFIPGDGGIVPAKLIASLVIDDKGNFQKAVVIQIEPKELKSEKMNYEQVINDMFKNEQFTAAYNQDGSKPEFSNLFVRIVINPKI
ncbi:hypothetical protein [Nostoc sp. FACHB-110]|uniref:hypothetical protein n=1 Tax=Nostoc sp. FACHB-110 TaxID=2692834 RepID=UPI001685CD48|nr:hypothetical protein [Nostoc sp. FACHB-110]MBD2437640.1 hypothetical protein [Nostoc sp. FACHB-110]